MGRRAAAGRPFIREDTIMNLVKEVDSNWAAAAVAAAANTDDASAIFDMANYEGIKFIQVITDSVETGVATLTAQQNTINSASGMAALSGAVVTGTAGADDALNNKLLILDVFRPLERYVRVRRQSATANIAFGEMIAIRYGGRVKPEAEGSTVIDSVLAISPAEA
jgi:hypothetical protein